MALIRLVKRLRDFPTNVNDVQFYKTEHEHVGEATVLKRNGTCSDPLFVPNTDRTLCVLAGRIDVGRHFILTGGLQGMRESVEDLTSRVQSFGRYHFDVSEHEEARALFDDPSFLALARRVCPVSKQHLDPFQFNFILQLPGQTVAAHIDAAYFWGATRFQFPQWLLAAMVFSGRFEDRFVNQVQVVAYLHRWHPASRRGGRAGGFVHWAGGSDSEWEIPSYLAGSAIDGSKSVHAADIYLGGAASPRLPRIDKSRRNVLRFEGPADADGWALRVNGEELLQRYSTDDLRMSVVYRARCFESADEAEAFDGNGGPPEQKLSLSDVLSTLADEMVQRGAVASAEAALKLDRRTLAVLILDTFVHYPLPQEAWLPFNYCALPSLLPTWAAPAATGLLSVACKAA